MQTQLIQKKAQIGSQVEFRLTTGDLVSGLLKEISLEHVTLDAAKGEMTILVESIIGVQSLDNMNASESPANIPDPGNQVNTSESSNSKPNNIEVPDSTSFSPTEIEVPEDTDANTEPIASMPKEVEASDAAETKAESTDSMTEVLKIPDDADVNTESNASVNFEEQISEKLIEIEKRFSNQIESAKLKLEPPDLTFPAEELTGWQSTTIAGEWIRIKNKYENAEKINELSAKFGRIQPLVIELKSLVKRFP
ncbi:hypothetical protein F4009_06675, partial [Candidatus Poribacteria bacterium]|nr:hypothetical protein [Candidatus Poribacteria bacterium]